MNVPKPFLKRFAPGVVVAVALLGVLFIAMDYGQIQRALGQASWIPIPYAVAATVISYFCISYSFARVSEMLGIRMRSRELTAVGFVTSVLNHVVSSGGAAGYSVRFMVMGRHGASSREVIATSILHFYLTSLVMMAMLPVGLIYLLLHSSVSRTAASILIALASLVLLVSILGAGLVFWSVMRKRVIEVLVKAARVLMRRDIAPAMERFEATMGLGVEAFRRQPMCIVGIMILIAMDWTCSAIALWFCFLALGVMLRPGQLISGFVIGTVAGVASMVPGGLGVREGSMAGLFGLLGISLERALLASILFRVVYFMIPYAISLGFYWRLLHAGGDGRSAGGQGV